MKTDDRRPGGAQPPFDDEGLSRLHRAYSTEVMPPEVGAAVLAAARRLAHDDELSRLHRAYSVEKAPTAMNEAVLAAAARAANRSSARLAGSASASSGRASALWRFKLPVAMAAAVLMATALLQLREHSPDSGIEMLGTQSSRRAEDQLIEIRRLLAQGRSVEAAELLAGFRKQYPQKTVPEDIEKKLGGR